MKTTIAQQIAAVQELAKYEIKGTNKVDAALFQQCLKDAGQTLIAVAVLMNDKNIAHNFEQYVMSAPLYEGYAVTIEKFLKQIGLPICEQNKG